LLFDLYYGGNSPVPTLEEKTQDKDKLAAMILPSPKRPLHSKIFTSTISRAREQVALFFFKAYQK